MTDELRETLDAFTPPADDARPDWTEVLRRIETLQPRRGTATAVPSRRSEGGGAGCRRSRSPPWRLAASRC